MEFGAIFFEPTASVGKIAPTVYLPVRDGKYDAGDKGPVAGKYRVVVGGMDQSKKHVDNDGGPHTRRSSSTTICSRWKSRRRTTRSMSKSPLPKRSSRSKDAAHHRSDADAFARACAAWSSRSSTPSTSTAGTAAAAPVFAQRHAHGRAAALCRRRRHHRPHPARPLPGPAWVADLTGIEPKALITVAHLGPLAKQVQPGDGLLAQDRLEPRMSTSHSITATTSRASARSWPSGASSGGSACSASSRRRWPM